MPDQRHDPSTDKPINADDPAFDDQLLDTGQEEVFSRAEVEGGVTEHKSDSGKSGGPTAGAGSTPEPQGRIRERTAYPAPNA